MILDIFEYQPENIVLKTIAQLDFPVKILDGYLFLIPFLWFRIFDFR